MEILWWWAPAAVLTLTSIVAVSWYGRDGRGEVDRDEAVKRMAEALATQPRYSQPRVRTHERSTGIAVRPARPTPTAPPAPAPSPWSEGPDSA